MDRYTFPIIGIERLRIGTDGPGVRTLVGLKGCPLRCKYCLNPHSWDDARKPALYSPRQLYDKVAIDSIYFQSTNGGLTFGGGEPLLHTDAISSFALLCPKTWTLWAETSLNVDPFQVAQASHFIHHFVVDIKSTDPDIYRAYTGQELKRAMDNLLMLKNIIGPERITVRIPVIPGFAAEADRQKSAELLTAKGFQNLDLFTYRTDVRK